MAKSIQEICRLVQLMTGSRQVALSIRHNDTQTITRLSFIVDRPAGAEWKNRAPVVSRERRHLFSRDIKEFREFDNHPLLELVPNLKSIECFLWPLDESDDLTFLILNPQPSYFGQPDTQRNVEMLANVAKMIFTDLADAQHSQVLDLPADNQHNQPPEPVNPEPIAKFLADTLLAKQRLLTRNTTSYVALRQWRKPIKAYQISALKALKSQPDNSLTKLAADEMCNSIKKIYGNDFDIVVPVPGGSSGRSNSFSVELARQIAENLNVRFSDILVPAPVRTGSSHPAKSAKLQPYRLSGAETGRALIIDDVATSGRHLELAAEALLQCCSHASAIVWIAD